MTKLVHSSLSLIFLSNYYFTRAFTPWRIIGLGKIHNGLYILQIHALDSQSSQSIASFYQSAESVCFHSANNIVASTSNLTSLQLWHCQLGHPSFDKIHFLHQVVPKFHTINKDSHFCDVCPLAKQKRLPFPNAGHKSMHIFDLIHCDIWGFYFLPTRDGFKYFLTIVNDCSHSTWIYLMTSKADTRSLLISFFTMIET